MGGVCGTGGAKSQAAKEIQRRLAEKQKPGMNEIKVLLLGTGESGKSTIFKQMRLMYGAPEDNTNITPETLQEATTACFMNIIEGAKAMVLARAADPSLPDINPTSSQKIENAITTIIESSDEPTSLPESLARAIALLWNDANFQALWTQRSKIQVLDCWGYFANKCNNYPAWGGPQWCPTEQEYLFIRTRTTGKATAKFTIDNRTFELIDVGGQKSERKKWTAVFSGVSSVLFVAAASEYDQQLFEDTTVNRLVETFQVFESNVNHQAFEKSTFILFLNKSDIFKEKLVDRRIPLNISGLFPDAPTEFDYDKGIDWLMGRFKKLVNTQRVNHPDLVIHVTTATDKNKAKVVLEASRRQILKMVLDDMGFRALDI